MDAKKLVRQIRKPELSQHDFELTEEEAVALLTRAIEEETQAIRAQMAELREAKELLSKWYSWQAEKCKETMSDNDYLNIVTPTAELLSLVEAGTGKAKCRGNECEDFGCEECPASKCADDSPNGDGTENTNRWLPKRGDTVFVKGDTMGVVVAHFLGMDDYGCARVFIGTGEEFVFTMKKVKPFDRLYVGKEWDSIPPATDTP